MPGSPRSRGRFSDDGQHASRLLLATGCALLGLCIYTAIEREGGLAGTLAVLALGAIALAVFEPHIHNFKAGPSGIEFETNRREESRLSAELGQRLGDIDLIDLASGRAVELSSESHADIERLLQAIATLQEELAVGRGNAKDEPTPGARLQMARGMFIERRWKDAAEMLDRYVEAEPNDWEAQFSRGAAHANSRAGRESNIAALRAYNEALALTPREHAQNRLPRFFGYRGAILKRLERLEEAENDLLIARRLVRTQDDANDITYNLAAVYALSERPEAALEEIRTLVGTRFIGAIRTHASDYFASLADISEFQEMIRAR
jgi:Flp pilus assembly protein TadD